jgi:DNA polymerase I-like protein with 3'-5' exonuclease and polymerase domains
MIDPSKLKPLILSELKPPMNITLVTPDSGLPELSSFITKKLETKGLIGLDTETNICNDFYQRKVRTIQVGDKEQQFVIDLLTFAGSGEALSTSQGFYKLHACFKPVFDILVPAICNNIVLKVGQNLSFEYSVFWWNFGQRIWHLYSTDLAERVVQAGRISLKKMAEFSMASIVARRFNMLVDKTEQEGFDLETPLTQKQIEYAAFDARMPLSMREHQLREMTVDQLVTTGQIEYDALGAYADMHLNGMRIDSERWMKRIDQVFAERVEQLKALDAEFIPKVGRKDEQINFVEMARREKIWREDFETSTPEEMSKAEEIRRCRDNTQKAMLRAELNALKKLRTEKKAEAKKSYMELQKAHTKFKTAVLKMEGEAHLNYGSNDQLLAALKKFKGMGTLEGAGDDHLLKYNDRPFIQTLRRYRKGKKDTSVYGKVWTQVWTTKPCSAEGWRHPWDGRIHARFQQLEAETGRTSCAQPNMQNLPHEEEVRACFVARPPDAEEPDGYSIITIDMSGAELRIIAELAHATSWINAFNKNQDVHSVCTEILYPEIWPSLALSGCAYYEKNEKGEPKRLKCTCPEHKKLRDHSKALNFGLCYGAGPNALADALGITLDAAKELMRLHEQKFPDIWKYLNESGERAQRLNEARDLYGRRRLLPAPTWESSKEYFKEEHADRLELEEETCERNVFNFKASYLRDPSEEETYKLTHREPNEQEIKQAMRGLWGSISRKGKNHCVQGSNASIIKRAMSCGFDVSGKPYLWHLLPQYKGKLLSMVHDELVLESPKRHAKGLAECVADCFRRAAAEVMKNVVMESEYRISDRWQK